MSKELINLYTATIQDIRKVIHKNYEKIELIDSNSGDFLFITKPIHSSDGLTLSLQRGNINSIFLRRVFKYEYQSKNQLSSIFKKKRRNIFGENK